MYWFIFHIQLSIQLQSIFAYGVRWDPNPFFPMWKSRWPSSKKAILSPMNFSIIFEINQVTCVGSVSRLSILFHCSGFSSYPVCQEYINIITVVLQVLKNDDISALGCVLLQDYLQLIYSKFFVFSHKFDNQIDNAHTCTHTHMSNCDFLLELHCVCRSICGELTS